MNELAAEARRLRMEEGLSGRQIQHRLGVPKQRLQDWLRGVPPPEWTRRPNAKDDLRAQAVALRQEGWSVNDNIRFRLYIHESADAAAFGWWSALVGVPAS